jgi:hypothetical protein
VSGLRAAVRLDALTVSPYWRQLLPLVGAVGLLSVVSGQPVVVVVAGAVFGSLLASYPFAVGDKHDLDVLRAVLPVPRRTLVAARYVFALGAYAVLAVLTTTLAVLGAGMQEPSMSPDAGDVVSALATSFGVYAVLAGTQLPVYFALGYTRGRMVAVLPLVLLSSGIGAGVSLLGDGAPDLDLWLAQWADRLAPVSLAVGVVVLALSAAVSWRADAWRAARADGAQRAR